MHGTKTELSSTFDSGNVSFAGLMKRVRDGEQEAATYFHRRWAGRLVRLARLKLGRTAAGKEDAEDVVQSVYRSFFHRYGNGQFQVGDWENAWSLLAKIAIRKCGSRRERYQALLRDTRREMPLVNIEVSGPDDSAAGAAMLSETIERLLDSLKGNDRTIVEFSLEGTTIQEIAEQLGCSERTVFRVRDRVRDILTRWNEQPED